MEKKKLSIKEIGLPKLLLLFGAGILLLVLSLPDGKTKTGTGTGTGSGTTPNAQSGAANVSGMAGATNGPEGDRTTEEMEERLETLLKKVKGIGDVTCMITLKSTKERVVLKDSPYTSNNSVEVDGEGGQRTVTDLEQGEETILVEGDGTNAPYVIKEISPEVEGVVVIAEGAGDAKIVSEIVEAVEVLFGVPAHKVKVMKMGN